MGIPFDAITEKEWDMFDTYRNAYDCTNDEEGDRTIVSNYRATAKEVLTIWNSNKYNLFKLFGEQLIVKKDIAFKASYSDVEDELSDIMDNAFLRKLRNLVNDRVAMVEAYNTTDVKTLIDNTEENIYGTPYVNLRTWPGTSSSRCCYLSTYLWGANEDYFANTISTDTFYIYVVNEKKAVKFEHGSSLMKALGKLASLLHFNEEFEQFRIDHSRVTNTKLIRGRLCLSIHPLDYMTMSDNDYNWSSCMSWADGGCYRRGTVEMMNSTSVIVAYLDGGEFNGGLINGFTWNNKKWRTLIIVDPSFAITIKAYPYASDNLNKEALEMIRELAKKNWHIDYDEGISHYGPSNEVHYATYTDEIYFECNTMYNDFCRGQRSHMLTNSHNPYNARYFNYSGPDVCMNCGSSDCSYASNGDVCCSTCLDVYDDDDYIGECWHCGRSIYEGDEYAYDEVNERYYCYDHSDRVAKCHCCGTRTDISTIHPVLISYKGFGAKPMMEQGREITDYSTEEMIGEMDGGICDYCLSRKELSPFVKTLTSYPKDSRIKMWDIDAYLKLGVSKDQAMVDIDDFLEATSPMTIAYYLQSSEGMFSNYSTIRRDNYNDIEKAMREDPIVGNLSWSTVYDAKRRLWKAEREGLFGSSASSSDSCEPAEDFPF